MLPCCACLLPLLQYNRGAVEAAFGSGAELDEDGLEDAFELVAEVPEKIRCALVHRNNRVLG